MNTRMFRIVGLALIVVIGPSTVLHAQNQADLKVATLFRESYALEAKGDYGAAAAKVREARQASNSYFAVVRLAWLQYLAGDYTSSASSYTEAVALEPKAIEPKVGLTLPLLAGKKWKELDRACRDVLALDPMNVSAQARLAQALYWNSNYADSAATYQKLTAAYPSNLDYKTGLGWALLKQGRTADARQLFQVVLAVSPDNPSAKEGMAVK